MLRTWMQTALRLTLIGVVGVGLAMLTRATPAQNATISYLSVRDQYHIYLLDIPLMLALQAVDDPNWNGNPHWSWQSRRMVFESNRSGSLDIYSATANGANVQRLTTHPARDMLPRWSADGTSVYFLSDRDGQFGLYQLTLADQLIVPILLEPNPVAEPALSPNDERIAYVRLDDPNLAGDFEVFITETANPTRSDSPLTRAPRRSHTPVWSPDGTQIAFSSDRDGNFEIYTVEVATGVVRRLTENDVWDRNPAWVFDGGGVVFESFRNGDWELYLIQADGTGERRVTYNAGRDGNPR